MIVVAHGGDELAVGRQRNRWIRPSVALETAEKFRCQMRGVRRAAAIAANQQLVAAEQRAQHQQRRAIQRLLQRGQIAKRGDGFFDGALQMTHANSLIAGR